MYVTLHKQHFKSILGVESDQIDEFDKKYILMFKIDEEELSDEEEEEEEEKKEMHFVENEQLVDILNEAYPKIRGKLNLSRLVLLIPVKSSRCFLAMMKRLSSPETTSSTSSTSCEPWTQIRMSSSLGKKESESAHWPGLVCFVLSFNLFICQTRFSTLFMGLELITMDAEDSDWKEIFRQALLDASRFDLGTSSSQVLFRDVADMIIVLDPEYVEKNEVLATISDIRAYGFRFCLCGIKFMDFGLFSSSSVGT